jgi:putative membrane protein
VRVVYFEKGASYYFGNVFFLIKLALFVLVAIASIYPTRRFIAWRKDLAAGRAPASTTAQMRTTQRLLHVQLLGVVLITLCAALMARGIG